MKIERQQAPFAPVTITLESREEVGILAALICNTTYYGRAEDYQTNARENSALFPTMAEEALFGASHAFSTLYARLNAVLNNK